MSLYPGFGSLAMRSPAPRMPSPSPFGSPVGAVVPAYARTARSVLYPDSPQTYKRGASGFVKIADMPNGVVLWEGRSKFDGAPIAVILTGIIDPSANEKTDDMIQSWIIRTDINPVTALHSGEDASICANCPKRPALVYAGATRVGTGKKSRMVLPGGGRVKRGDACYVAVHNAPRQIWETYRAGKYPRVTPAQAVALVRGRLLRIGSYGDPAATPVEAWLPIIRVARDRTGYTHQWCRPDAQAWRPYCMASVETQADAMRAAAMGWRYFRAGHEPLMPGEARCPAAKEAGELLTCAACKQCNGAENAPRRPSRVIRPH